MPVQRSPLIDKKTEIVFTFFLLVFLTERSFCHRHNPTYNLVRGTRYSIHVRVLRLPMNDFFLPSLPPCLSRPAQKTLLLPLDISQLVKIRSQQFRLITTINEQIPHTKTLAKTYPFNKVRPVQLLIRRAKRDQQSANRIESCPVPRLLQLPSRPCSNVHDASIMQGLGV